MGRFLVVVGAGVDDCAVNRARRRSSLRGGHLRKPRLRRAGAGLRNDRRGQARPRSGQACASDHRALRLPHLRRQRPGPSRAHGQLPAGEDPGRERLLAGRGHGDRYAPQADHRRARPASRRRRPDRLSGHRHALGQEPQPQLRQRLLRDLLPRPGRPAPDRRLRRAAIRAHGQLHPRLSLDLDRRPGPPRRPADALSRRVDGLRRPASAATAAPSG